MGSCRSCHWHHVAEPDASMGPWSGQLAHQARQKTLWYDQEQRLLMQSTLGEQRVCAVLQTGL